MIIWLFFYRLTIKYVISIHNNNKSLLGGNSSFLNGKRWRSLHLIQGIPKRPGLKYSGKMSIPREQPNQNKEMKIADSVLLSLFSRHTKLSPHFNKYNSLYNKENIQRHFNLKSNHKKEKEIKNKKLFINENQITYLELLWWTKPAKQKLVSPWLWTRRNTATIHSDLAINSWLSCNITIRRTKDLTVNNLSF